MKTDRPKRNENNWIRRCILVFTAVVAFFCLVQSGTHHWIQPVRRQLRTLSRETSPSSSTPSYLLAPQCDEGTMQNLCQWFAKGREDVGDETHWGKQELCETNTTQRMLQCAQYNCVSCLDGTNVCQEQPRLLFHQLLYNIHPTNWRGNLQSIQSFLMTQDLRRSRMIIWVKDKSAVYTAETSPFFDAFKDYVEFRDYEYSELIRGTPLEKDPFFGNETLVTEKVYTKAGLSDIARVLLLHMHGGVWIDNDVVFLRDLYPLVMQIGYQFVERWMNNHVMYMKAKSPLSYRLLEIFKRIPMDAPDFENTVIRDICKPVGYYQMAADSYGYCDIYNACAMRLAMKVNNKGPVDLTLFDYPLSWFDSEWVGCMGNREAVSDEVWGKLSRIFFTLHTRYPADGALIHGDASQGHLSPIGRSKVIIDAFFDQCRHPSCVPIGGHFLSDYSPLA